MVTRRGAAVVVRILAATVGTYVLGAVWAAAFARAWPGGRADAVLLGTGSSFLVGTLAVIWVFAAATAGRALVGLTVCILPLGLIASGL